jgi:hypothetical protein
LNDISSFVNSPGELVLSVAGPEKAAPLARATKAKIKRNPCKKKKKKKKKLVQKNTV